MIILILIKRENYNIYVYLKYIYIYIYCLIYNWLKFFTNANPLGRVFFNFLLNGWCVLWKAPHFSFVLSLVYNIN